MPRLVTRTAVPAAVAGAGARRARARSARGLNGRLGAVLAAAAALAHVGARVTKPTEVGSVPANGKDVGDVTEAMAAKKGPAVGEARGL